MRNQKSGQAAMEFLMTYGWAILAAVIVIAALAAFGVFSPKNYVPTECLLSAPLGCEQNQVAASATTGISLVIRNGGVDTVNISQLDIPGCATSTTGWTINDGETQLVTIACTPVLTEGDKFTGDITATYRVTGGELDQISTGRIVVQVAA